MIKNRKFFSIVLIVMVMSVFTLGCGSSQNKTASQPGQASQASQGDSKVYTIKYGHALPETHHTHLAVLEMKKFVEEKSNGRLKMEVYGNGQLGSDRQLIEGVQLGSLQMTNGASGSYTTFSKAAMVFDLPFLLTSDEQAYKILDGPIGQEILDALTKDGKGFKALSYGVSGLRNITNNKKPINSPEDLRGLKIRTMENPMHIEAFKAYGANPTPMAMGEVYTALQQGTVDGQENPISNIFSNKFFEVQKYMSLTGHVYLPQIEIVSEALWKSLPEDLQKILLEGSARVRRDSQRKFAAEYDAEAMKAIKQKTAVNEVSPQGIEAFKKVAQPIYDKFKGEIGASLVDKIVEATKK